MGTSVFVATETGTTDIDGQLYSFHKGQTRVAEGHPLLKHCAGLFAPAEESVTYDLETATSSPRGKRRRGPKPAESKDETGERPGDGDDDQEPSETASDDDAEASETGDGEQDAAEATEEPKASAAKPRTRRPRGK